MPRILVVDDDPHIRDVIRFALEKAGMRVVTVADGGCALDAFSREPVDLIVLDIGMPELDGLDVCRQIRRTRCRSCSCRHGTRRSTVCWALKSVATIM